MYKFSRKKTAGIQQIANLYLYTRLISALEKLIACRYINW